MLYFLALFLGQTPGKSFLEACGIHPTKLMLRNMSRRGEVPHQKSHDRQKAEPGFPSSVGCSPMMLDHSFQPSHFRFSSTTQSGGQVTISLLSHFAFHWLLLVPQAWGGHTDVKNLVLPNPNRKNMARKQSQDSALLLTSKVP